MGAVLGLTVGMGLLLIWHACTMTANSQRIVSVEEVHVLPYRF
jgi:hypothetical protein